MLDRDELEQWSQSTCTSIEIAEQIMFMSDSADQMERIFNDPTYKERADIISAAKMKTDEPLEWGCETI